MRNPPGKWTLAMAATTLLCSACVSTITTDQGGAKAPAYNADASQFGDEYAVRVTVGTVKSQGERSRLGSRAIRLPEQPLSAIDEFTYRFPAQCGGHEFHVYETGATQILEYRYDSEGGTYRIRDYVADSNPFVKPGLWTAYDHTADSVASMTSQLGESGDRMFKGMYSQGLVTSLPTSEQQALGNAYRRALGDAYACGTI